MNISTVQFRGRTLVPAVTDALEASGLDPARLELEITESVMVHDFDSALAVLHQLKKLGVTEFQLIPKEYLDVRDFAPKK